MPRKKKVVENPRSKKSPREELEELGWEYSKKSLSPDILNNELEEGCLLDAELLHEQLCKERLSNKLTFLWSRGWSITKLKELLDKELATQEKS